MKMVVESQLVVSCTRVCFMLINETFFFFKVFRVAHVDIVKKKP
jgi:hypothetical protein